MSTSPVQANSNILYQSTEVQQSTEPANKKRSHSEAFPSEDAPIITENNPQASSSSTGSDHVYKLHIPNYPGAEKLHARMTAIIEKAQKEALEEKNAYGNQQINAVKSQLLALPDEIQEKILGYLTYKDRAIVSTVCRKLHELGSEMNGKINFFNEEKWSTYVDVKAKGLDFSDKVPLSHETIQSFLKSFDLSKITNNAGITFVTIPKGLTLELLFDIAKNPKQGNRIHPDNIKIELEEVEADGTELTYIDRIMTTPVPKTYHIAISNDIILGSTDKEIDDDFQESPLNRPETQAEFDQAYNEMRCYDEAKKLIKTLKGRPPQILPLATMILFHFIGSPKESPTILYKDYFTRVSDEDQDGEGYIGVGFWNESFYIISATDSACTGMAYTKKL